MTRSAKLLEDGVICPENIQEYLLENDDYLVVGIVGSQGVGKSTILNLLAHNNITDTLKNSIFKYSESKKRNSEDIKILSDNVKSTDNNGKQHIEDIIFKPQSSSNVARNSNGTYGIDFFVTYNRVRITAQTNI